MKQHFFCLLYAMSAITLVPGNAKSQRLDDVTNAISQSLLKHGIDTVIIYRPCNGSNIFMPTDSSVVEDISYIITKKDGLLNIERFTYEYPANRGLILTHNFIFKKDSMEIFQYLHANFKSIFSDTLRRGLLKYRINNKDTLMSTLSSHPCYMQLIVKTVAGSFTNGTISDDLDDGTIRDAKGKIKIQRENINYQYNISTTIYKIMTKLELLEMDIQKIFVF